MGHIDANDVLEIVAKVKSGDVILGGYVDLDQSRLCDSEGRWINEAYVDEVLSSLPAPVGMPGDPR